jgi:hypothetical protein
MNIEEERRKKRTNKVWKKEWKERKLKKTTRFEHAGEMNTVWVHHFNHLDIWAIIDSVALILYLNKPSFLRRKGKRRWRRRRRFITCLLINQDKLFFYKNLFSPENT